MRAFIMQYPVTLLNADLLNTKRFFESRPTQVLVKICGMTNPADAEDAIEAGADAIGFNIVPKSKRYLDLGPASGWISNLPPSVAKIVVAMDPTMDRALPLLSNEWVDALQLHGQESPDFCALLVRKARKPLIKAVPAIDRASVQTAKRYRVFALLLDSSAGMTLGGTGKTFDWQKFAGLDLGRPLIVSGGLTPENVATAVRVLNPHTVDVATGVEFAPGRKDPIKMRDFVAAAKGM
jgi:phosphoribosylanthranilate isomerase